MPIGLCGVGRGAMPCLATWSRGMEQCSAVIDIPRSPRLFDPISPGMSDAATERIYTHRSGNLA